MAERQRDFRKEVEAAQPPAGATGEGRILPEREMSQKATEGWERERACPAGAYLHRLENGPQHCWKAIFVYVELGGVQTTCREACYTRILPLVVGRGMPEGGLSEAYPLGLDLL